jgi:hypothetical protein
MESQQVLVGAPAAAPAVAEQTQKFSLFALTAMVVGSMVGAGIFSLPRAFGTATGPFGAIIAWTIAAGGMYTLARVFQALAERKPDLDAGVYAYAKAGFGDYLGFLSAFGYFISACLGNTFYWVLIKSTLGAFFPIFGNGDTLAAVVISSIGIWIFHFTVLRGVQQAAAINKIVTVAKLVPILLFIVILAVSFRGHLFAANFWGGEGMPETSLFEQVRATMLVTVFVFLGIEGASVYSRYAQKRSDVGTATIFGFIGVTCLMVLVTLLSYSVLPRAEIAGLRQPVDGDRSGGRRRPLGSGLYQPRADRVGARRLPRMADDRCRSPVQRGKDRGHAENLRHGEPEQGSGRRSVAEQHHRSALRDQHAVLRGRVYAGAEVVRLDVADPLPARRRLRAADRAARRNL